MSELANLTGDENQVYTITITDSSVNASEISTLENKTSVALNLSNVSTIVGTDGEIKAVYVLDQNGDVSGLGNEALSVSNTSTITELNDLDLETTGVITATVESGNASTMSSLTNANSNNAYSYTLTDTSIAASTLNTLNAATAGTITVSATTIT